MSIEINNVNPNRPENLRKQDSKPVSGGESTAPKKDSAETNNSTADSVSLSNTAKSLTAIENEIKSLPDFDQAKVDEIRARIQSGEYHIDPEKLAQKMLDMES